MFGNTVDAKTSSEDASSQKLVIITAASSIVVYFQTNIHHSVSFKLNTFIDYGQHEHVTGGGPSNLKNDVYVNQDGLHY